MNNAAASYFVNEFNQTVASAAAIASIFGWMNLFARGIGGYVSDKVNSKMGMRGRLIWQGGLLVVEGILIFLFANSKSLAGAIVLMVVFSTVVQAAEGSTYGIVPYVNPPVTGSIAGVVGAGGNVGAVCFGLGFRQMDNIRAFYLMGGCVLASGILTAFISIKGHAGLLWGKDSDEAIAAYKRTLQVPNANAESEEGVDEA